MLSDEGGTDHPGATRHAKLRVSAFFPKRAEEEDVVIRRAVERLLWK
jgi:hypothetical protein